MRQVDMTLVVDRTESGESLRAGLEEYGCNVEMVLRILTQPDQSVLEKSPMILLIIDTNSAGALSWCRDLRNAHPEYRICVLFETATELDLVIALEMGADTALVKPVSDRRLAAQLHALGRPLPRFAGRYAVGALEVIEGSREAKLAGQPLDLTDTEFDLLLLLIRHQGSSLSRDTIKREMRGLPYDSRDRSIDLGMVRLRRKLGDDARRPRFIKTVRGLGYMLITPSL